MVDDAVLTVDRDGRLVDGNEAALDLLGVTLDELRAAPPGAFGEAVDPDEQAARAPAWQESGSDRAAGEGTIRRLDGTPIRVSFVLAAQDDGRFVVAMRPATESTDLPPRIFTATADALAAWRAAERRLEVVSEGSPEWQQLQADIAHFRAEYQRLFAIKRDARRRVS